MPFNVGLVLALVAAMSISNLTTAHVRGVMADLDAAVRDRIEHTLAKSAMLWQALEWAGIIMMLLSMFTSIFGRSLSFRFFLAGCGAAFVCLVVAASAWHMYRVIAREAPGSPAQSAARNSALLVTVVEFAVIGVLFWLLNGRVDWTKVFGPGVKTGSAQTEESEAPPKELWVDETIALKELNWMKLDEIKLIVDSGMLKTKSVAGKTVYRNADIERLKAQHKSNATLPND